jgi:hypothetical protein
MKKSSQNKRLSLVLEALAGAHDGITVSDVHRKLIEEHKLDVSRKTIERDIAEIVKKGFYILDPKTPITISPRGIRECIIHLSNEDITYLLVVLPDKHPIRDKLKTFMGLDKFCLDHE